MTLPHPSHAPLAARIWAAVCLTASLVAAQEPAHREIRFADGRYYLEAPEGARELADVTGFCIACHGVRPSGVRPSGVRPSGVRPSGVRPSGVRPSGVRPSGDEGGAPSHPTSPGRGGSGPDIGALGQSHPVDLDYPTAGGKLTAPEDLDRRLELRDGEMTCLTCHAAAAADHRLVIPTRGGELCQACHRQ